jgi:hypothetical protein
MGGSQSRNSSTITQSVTNEINSRCSPTHAQNVTNIKNLDIDVPAGQTCPSGSRVSITQATNVDASCQIGATVDTLAQQVSELSANAKAGLGLSNSSNSSVLATELKNKVENECAGASSTNLASWDGGKIRTCDFIIAQNATVKDMCVINALSATTTNVATKAKAEAEGGSVWEALFGRGSGRILMILLIIVAIIALIGGIVYLKKSPQGQAASAASAAGLVGGAGSSTIWYVVIILGLLLIGFLIYQWTRPTTTVVLPNNTPYGTIPLTQGPAGTQGTPGTTTTTVTTVRPSNAPTVTVNPPATAPAGSLGAGGAPPVVRTEGFSGLGLGLDNPWALDQKSFVWDASGGYVSDHYNSLDQYYGNLLSN